MPRAETFVGRACAPTAMRSCAALMSCVALMSFAASESRAQPAARRGGAVRVAVGEMGDADAALASAVGDALAGNPDVELTATRRAQLVVRGSVVRWDRHAVQGGGMEVRCEVSLILADARGGSIRAMLRGRGGARGGADVSRLSEDALRAAVRGALRPLATTGHALAHAS